MSPLTLTDLHSGSLEYEVITYSVSTTAASYFLVRHYFCFGFFVFFSDSVLKVYPVCQLCIFLCTACCHFDFFSLAQQWIDASLRLLCVADSVSVFSLSLFLFLPPLFSGLDCFQEPYGVMPALCACVCVFPCARLPVCVPLRSFLSIFAVVICRIYRCVCSSLPL